MALDSGQGQGCQWNPKELGPNKVAGAAPTPLPPINKVSAPSQGAGTGQEQGRGAERGNLRWMESGTHGVLWAEMRGEDFIFIAL